MAEKIIRSQELSNEEAVKEVVRIGERFERQAKLAEVTARLDKERRQSREREDDRTQEGSD